MPLVSFPDGSSCWRFVLEEMLETTIANFNENVADKLIKSQPIDMETLRQEPVKRLHNKWSISHAFGES
jgi:hypothetical protein